MRRVVLKVGSAVLSEDSKLATSRVENLVEFISQLKEKEYEVILVSSGAVAAGYTLVKLDKTKEANKQALAAIGQPLLMKEYQERFAKFNIKCAQVLLTADDFDSRKRTRYAKNAIEVLLKDGIVPIINENDVTATSELIFGDNDQLSSAVTYFFNANLLVILTDIDGYYNKNPQMYNDAKMLKEVKFITNEMLNEAHTPNTKFSTGGIVTKLKAAKFLLDHNLPTFLTSGFELEYAKEFLLNNNHTKGTLFR